jgi:hypothetical protein
MLCVNPLFATNRRIPSSPVCNKLHDRWGMRACVAQWAGNQDGWESGGRESGGWEIRMRRAAGWLDFWGVVCVDFIGFSVARIHPFFGTRTVWFNNDSRSCAPDRSAVWRQNDVPVARFSRLCRQHEVGAGCLFRIRVQLATEFNADGHDSLLPSFAEEREQQVVKITVSPTKFQNLRYACACVEQVPYDSPITVDHRCSPSVNGMKVTHRLLLLTFRLHMCI